MLEYLSAGLSVVQGVSGFLQGNRAAKTQKKWDEYNAKMAYNTSMINLDTQAAIDKSNIASLFATTELNAQVVTDTTEFNASMLEATTTYNNSLLESDLEDMWEATGLDLEMLHRNRAVERGGIEAVQSASGVLMGQDSSAVVIMDQRAQEGLDAFVVQHGADIQASKIQNSIAANTWQGEMEIKKMKWEGEVANKTARTNAQLQASTLLTQSGLSSNAARVTAGYGYSSSMASAQSSYAAGKQSATNALTSGLFKGVSSATDTYYANKDKQ